MLSKQIILSRIKDHRLFLYLREWLLIQMHICLSGICWVWKRFPDWVEKWSLQLSCNFNLENEWMDPVQSFGWDPVFKIHRTMSMWLHSQLVSDLGRESVKILVTFLHLSKLRPIQETQTACKCGLYTKGSVCVCVFFFQSCPPDVNISLPSDYISSKDRVKYLLLWIWKPL